MNNPFGSLLLQLQARIKAVASAIREVNEDKGQLEGYELRPAVSFPCVLIDFDFQFDDLGDNIQMASGNVIVRLAFPPFSSAGSLMPQGVREKALAYTDYEMQVYQALHGWRPTGFAPLSRRAAVTEKRTDTIRVREIRFDTQFEDYSAADEHSNVSINNFEVSGEFTS
ncbi:MAG: hypothetical protein JST88_09250 [Bacteroidetes bacterium]|nr:hypothetical protein [Bacteroidota bacterium]